MNRGKEGTLSFGDLTHKDLAHTMRRHLLDMRDSIDPKADKKDKSLTYVERAGRNITFLEKVIRENSQLFSEYFNRTDYAIGICHDRTLEGSMRAMSMHVPVPISQIVVDTDGVYISRAVEHGRLLKITNDSLTDYWQREQLLIKRFGDLTKRSILKKLAKSL